ncbi:hypothetical protein [Aeoliella sp.]|uniref:hypothetical protein n=1 Tax=Aeoliella sp. TaxID=2795800 RepID=UPI003CCC1600
MTESPNKWWRISLRELLIGVALLAIACTLLKFASPLLAGIVTSISALVAAVMVVFAVLDRGRWQAFAIGFITWCSIYGLLSSQTSSQLPTHSITNWAHRQVAVLHDYDFQAGEILGPYVGQLGEEATSESDAAANVQQAFPSGLSTEADSVVLMSSKVPVPRYDEFAIVFEALWMLFFAYLGGKFAVWVYLRRMARESESTLARSGDA